MKKITQAQIKEYIIDQTLYLIRWQLSTPLLAIVPTIMHDLRIIPAMPHCPAWIYWFVAFISNLIGGFIFFWYDRWLFTRRHKKA